MEETFTDKEFCRQFKIDRATSLRWRDQGIVSYLKLPNGQIRYKQSHIDELSEKFEKSALQNRHGAVKGRVVNIGIAERSHHGGVS